MEERESCRYIKKQWHVWRVRTVEHIELLLKPEEEENYPNHGQGGREGAEKRRFSGEWQFVSSIPPSTVGPSASAIMLW